MYKRQACQAPTAGWARFSAAAPALAYVRQYLRMGNREQALVWAEKAFTEPNRLVLDLVAEPEFDPLRSDPRFQAGVRSLRLPPPDPET